MATTYSVLGKYIKDGCYNADIPVQIGTRYHNGNVQASLDQLLELFRFVEQALLINGYFNCSLSSGCEVQNIFKEAESSVDAAVNKLTKRESPDDPSLLRIQSESVADKRIESVVGESVWEYSKSIAESYGLKTVEDLLEYIRLLASADKAFYSRWCIDDSIEFFDHPTRFSYAPLSEFDYWNEMLQNDAPIIANDTLIRTWSDLKKALRGENKSIGESEFSQGTFVRPLQEAIRLVPPPE